MSEMFDLNSNNGETSEPKKGDFSEVEFLRKRIKELEAEVKKLEAEVHGLRGQIATYKENYEKIANIHKEISSYHKEISSHLRWVNNVFMLLIGIILGGGVFSFAWLQQQAMERISSSNLELQEMINKQVNSLIKDFKDLNSTFEKRIENFGKDWSERLYKIEDRLNSLEKRLR
jgi:DNA repair exonuclease SbcCD ATPase subunit